jgi:hypothetical protein
MDAAGCLPVAGLGFQSQFRVYPANDQNVILGFDFADGFGYQP